MSVFLIADMKVTDDGWVPGYARNVHDLAGKHGGRYLSRSGNIETLEGSDKDSTVIADTDFRLVNAIRISYPDQTLAQSVTRDHFGVTYVVRPSVA